MILSGVQPATYSNYDFSNDCKCVIFSTYLLVLLNNITPHRPFTESSSFAECIDTYSSHNKLHQTVALSKF